jgi:hypothetical protein
MRDNDITWKDLSKIGNIPLTEDCRIDILKPGGYFTVKDSSLPRPLAFRTTYRDESFLSGEYLDSAEVQSALTETRGEALKSNVLYIPAIEAYPAFSGFLRAVSPQVLITRGLDPSSIQINPELRKFMATMTLYETSKDGAVTVRTEGESLSVKTYLGEQSVNLR